MATPLSKLNEIVAGLLQAQSFTASLGSVSSDSVWAAAVPNVLNGNALLVQPGPANTQVVVKASAMVMTVPLAGLVQIRAASDVPINSAVTLPIGARTDGTYYYFSQFTTWNETPVLLANKYSHIYVVYDSTKTNNLAIGIVASNSAADPGTGPLSNIGVTVSARQAVCFVNSSGEVTLLQVFPAIFNSIASVASDSAASFADWDFNATAVGTNAVQVQFTFPAGTGTGSIGEISVNLGSNLVAFLPISPQLLKDADVPLVLKWTIMIGLPGAFLP
jgi:hypothetical protein